MSIMEPWAERALVDVWSFILVLLSLVAALLIRLFFLLRSAKRQTAFEIKGLRSSVSELRERVNRLSNGGGAVGRVHVGIPSECSNSAGATSFPGGGRQPAGPPTDPGGRTGSGTEIEAHEAAGAGGEFDASFAATGFEGSGAAGRSMTPDGGGGHQVMPRGLVEILSWEDWSAALREEAQRRGGIYGSLKSKDPAAGVEESNCENRVIVLQVDVEKFEAALRPGVAWDIGLEDLFAFEGDDAGKKVRTKAPAVLVRAGTGLRVQERGRLEN